MLIFASWHWNWLKVIKMVMKYVSRISIRPRAQIAWGLVGAECCCLISQLAWLQLSLSVGMSMFSVTTAITGDHRNHISRDMANNTTAQHVDNYRMNNRRGGLSMVHGASGWWPDRWIVWGGKGKSKRRTNHHDDDDDGGWGQKA